MAPLPQLYEGSEIGLGAGLGIRDRLPPALPSTILSDAGSADCADEGDLPPSGAPTERLAIRRPRFSKQGVRLARRLRSGAVGCSITEIIHRSRHGFLITAVSAFSPFPHSLCISGGSRFIPLAVMQVSLV